MTTVKLPGWLAHWNALAAAPGVETRYRPTGVFRHAELELSGVYQAVPFKASERREKAQGSRTGFGGHGLRMVLRNHLHTGGERLTGHRAFDGTLDWEVSHRGYARLWLPPEIQSPLVHAEYWTIRFDEGDIVGEGSPDALGSALQGMTALARRGLDLSTTWQAMAAELGATTKATGFSVRPSHAIKLSARDLSLVIAPQLEDEETVATIIAASTRRRLTRDSVAAAVEATGVEVVDVLDDRLSLRIPELVLDAGRLRDVVTALEGAFSSGDAYR